MADYTRAIDKIQARNRGEDFPMLARLYWNRGDAHRSQGNAVKAEADLREAMRKDPTLPTQ